MRCGRSRRMRTTNVVRELSTHQAAMPPRVVVATQACHADLVEDACSARAPPWLLARRLPHEHFPMLSLFMPMRHLRSDLRRRAALPQHYLLD